MSQQLRAATTNPMPTEREAPGIPGLPPLAVRRHNGGYPTMTPESRSGHAPATDILTLSAKVRVYLSAV